MHADALAVRRGETRQREIVQVDESAQQIAGRIDFDGEPSLGKVDLHFIGAFLQTAAHLRFVLAQQVLDELVARVVGNPLGGIHET